MRITWQAYFVLLYLYRCVFSFLAQAVVLRLTAIPDSTGYQAVTVAGFLAASGSQEIELNYGMQRYAGLLTKAIALGFSLVFGGNAVLINIGFQSIAFLGIWMFLRAVDVGPRRYLAALVMLPSFTVWSSIASKEAIVVFLVCYLAKQIVDVYHRRDRLRFRHAFALALLFVFKPHFVPAILFLFFVSKFAGLWRRPELFSLLAGFVSLVPLYLLRDPIDQLARSTYRGVSQEPGASTRPGDFLVEKYDTFVKAPQGMWRAFVGPQLSETTSSFLHLVSYAESMLILAILAVYLLPRLPRMPVYLAIVSFFTVFWVMFSVYPLGLANPGTAIRYRTDFIMLIYLAVVVLTQREVFVKWRAVQAGRSADVRVASPAGASLNRCAP